MPVAVKLLPINPKVARMFDMVKLERELVNALEHTINIVNDDYKRTIRTWRRQPKFKKKRAQRTFRGLAAQVTTTNEIYGYVEEGTRSHIIRPRRAARLGFQTGYRAKTRVGVVGSRAGGSFGPFVGAKQVVHPGFPGRQFSKTIAKRRQNNLVNLTRLAFNRSFRV